MFKEDQSSSHGKKGKKKKKKVVQSSNSDADNEGVNVEQVEVQEKKVMSSGSQED